MESLIVLLLIGSAGVGFGIRAATSLTYEPEIEDSSRYLISRISTALILSSAVSMLVYIGLTIIMYALGVEQGGGDAGASGVFFLVRFFDPFIAIVTYLSFGLPFSVSLFIKSTFEQKRRTAKYYESFRRGGYRTYMLTKLGKEPQDFNQTIYIR